MIRFSSSSVSPEVAVTVIDCRWPVSRSRADDADDAVGADLEGDLDLHLAARRRAGGPVRTNSPSSSFSSARSLAPCRTTIFTEVWSSCEVVKMWLAEVGTVVFLGMSVWK